MIGILVRMKMRPVSALLSASGMILMVCGCHRPLGPMADADDSSPDEVVLAPFGGEPPVSGRDPSTLPAPLPREVGGAAMRGSTEPTRIDTTRFARQIDRRRFDGDPRRPAKLLPKHKKPPIETDVVDNGLRGGGVTSVARSTPSTGFPGIAQTPWSPPDPSIAVGPDHVVETVNMKVAWYEKDGTPVFEQFLDSTGNPGFFEEVGGGSFTFDPKCFYDPHVNRYVILALEYYSGAGESWITFAVSDDDDPNGVWFKYRTWALVESQGSTYWVDYPGFGYDERGWYITCNLFELGDGPGPGFAGGLLRVIDKSGPLAGTTADWSDVLLGGASWQVAQAPDSGDESRVVRQSSANSLEIGRIADVPSSPSVATDVVGVIEVQFDGSAPAPIGSGLWIVDPRVMNATIRDDRLWCTNHGILQGDTDASAVWYEVDVSGPSPQYVQGGGFPYGGGDHTFFPAVAVNGLGQVGIGYGRSGPNLHPTFEVSGRLPNDPPNTMAAGVQVGASVTSPDNGANLSRWGDYFDATVDPTDDRTFWVVGELQTPDGWVTEIHRFTIGLAADLNGDGLVNGADFGIMLSSFGNAGGPADLNRDGVVNGSDVGLMLGDWTN